MFSPAPGIPAKDSPRPHALQRTHPPRTALVLPQVNLGSNRMSSAECPLPQASIVEIAGKADPSNLEERLSTWFIVCGLRSLFACRPLCLLTVCSRFLTICSIAGVIKSVAPARPKVTLKELAVPVSPGDNPGCVLHEQASAYYYTQTHRNCHPEHAWFRGLNIAGRRVFNDYHLIVDGTALDPALAQVVAFPDALVRTY